MKLKNIEEIYVWNIEQLWNYTNTIKEQLTQEQQKQLLLVRNGIHLNIPIHYLINKYYQEYPTSKKIQVQGHGKYLINTFWEDLEQRETILRTIIQQYNEDDSPTQSRIKC